LEQIKEALLKNGYVASFVEGEGRSRKIIKSFAAEKNEFQLNETVCYCFGYTRKDIEQDFIKNGQSLIMAKIASEKKRGGCDCANKNPKGR
jgi:hypothetical protein